MNSFGRLFRVSIFGESHGPIVGVVIDGCPPGISFPREVMLEDLHRRRSGKKGTTTRREDDDPMVTSGIFEDKTTGAPITIMFDNNDVRSGDYDKIKMMPRPGHADFVAQHKYTGCNDHRGGGHFSGRLTVGLVAAGAIAKTIVDEVDIVSEIVHLGGSVDDVDDDSFGGIVECRASGIPVGWGEPFFDSVESLISHIIFAIPGVKGIEFGVGFRCADMLGSEYNDEIVDADGHTRTNNSGGINGGITNGNELVFRVAVRPTASIAKEQNTVDLNTGKQIKMSTAGRHDKCIALRFPVIVEAVTAIVLADLKLMR